MLIKELGLSKRTENMLTAFGLTSVDDFVSFDSFKPSDILEALSEKSKKQGYGIGIGIYKELLDAAINALVNQLEYKYKKQSENIRLTKVLNKTNPQTLDNLIGCMMAAIEDGLLQSGFESNIDYCRKDLLLAALPMIKTSNLNGEIPITTELPTA
jgi:hypothetical protein